jgi:branched-chain amino acid transport system permease protein
LDTSLLLTVLIDGVVLGLVYALIGLGLSLVWSLMGILNFAHVNFLLIAVYLGIMVFSFVSNPIIAVVGSLVLLAVITLVVYRTLITPVFKFGLDAAMMNTFALSYFLVITVLILAGPYYRSGVTLFPTDLQLHLPLDVTYSAYRVFAAAMAFLIVLGTMLLIRKTMFGLALKAAMQDTMASVLMGIKLKRVTQWGFLLAILLAGIAGLIIAPMYTVYPGMADKFGPISFAVAVVGGLGNIEGVIPAGIIIGLTETLGGTYISSAYKDAFTYILLIAILLIRPRGLLGRK